MGDSVWGHLGQDLVIRLVLDAAVGDAPDVAQQVLVALRRAAGEQAAGVDGAQSDDALRPRVQLPKSCDIGALRPPGI